MIIKRLPIIFSIITVAAIIAGCAKSYTTPHFNAKARDHKIVAVVPFEMVYTGKLPKNMTEQQKITIEEAESKAFQMALYNAILSRSGMKKKQIKIEVQPVEKTLRLLDTAGIGSRESWNLPPETLAKALGVDAIVRTKIEKERFMSDLASFGIQVAQDILDLLKLPNPVDIYTPGETVNKTYNVKFDSQIFNGNDGSLLWKVYGIQEADWDQKPDEIIHQLNYFLARRFPYTDTRYYYNAK